MYNGWNLIAVIVFGALAIFFFFRGYQAIRMAQTRGQHIRWYQQPELWSALFSVLVGTYIVLGNHSLIGGVLSTILGIIFILLLILCLLALVLSGWSAFDRWRAARRE